MQAVRRATLRISSLRQCQRALECPLTSRQSRCFNTASRRDHDGHSITIEHFRKVAFDAERPLVIPKGFFDLPAISKWFSTAHGSSQDTAPIHLLNHEYLGAHGNAIVPLELTRHDPETGDDSFSRLDRPLSDFLTYVVLREQAIRSGDSSSSSTASLYLAQHPLSALPPALQADVPTPGLVAQAGRGDVYASSLWLGWAPTATPLHRDPNPNLLVQLSGRKRVRLVAPDLGEEVLRDARRAAGTNTTNTAMRGDEMMIGAERRALDQWLWQPDGPFEQARASMPHELCEADFGPGGAVFIPKGWWHGVRGEGVGANGSVNWWFR